MRIALHPASWRGRRHGSCREILQAVPGIELVDLQQPAVGLRATISASCPHSSARCNGMSFGRG